MRRKRGNAKHRLLVFIVAYNAEKTIQWVLKRIPSELSLDFDLEILVIDDKSSDCTFKESQAFALENKQKFKITVLFNEKNQGYGGNQKIGYHYAIKNDFDFVVLVHGDGQYAPEEIPRLVAPLAEGHADAVFGSRMMEPKAALKGGMPLYKFVGNKILTTIQNKLLNTQLSEFHSGYRLYSVNALRKIPFPLNSNDFHFDTEIIIQLLFSGKKIKELKIPTYYGDEICHVNGLGYAYQVVKTSFTASMQKYSLLYDRKFDCSFAQDTYKPKFDYASPHSIALEKVRANSYVLDVGCAGGYIAEKLNKEKNCKIFGIDSQEIKQCSFFEGFLCFDIDHGLPAKTPKTFNEVLLLDILEHLSSPENFLYQLREHFKYRDNVTIHASTGNIAFFVTRILHMFGLFNYGKRGILDLTHKRLFTKQTFVNLFEQNGFRVKQIIGVPGPWQMLFGSGLMGKGLTNFNLWLCKLLPNIFSYQFFLTVEPCPHLDQLLKNAQTASKKKKLSVNTNKPSRSS